MAPMDSSKMNQQRKKGTQFGEKKEKRKKNSYNNGPRNSMPRKNGFFNNQNKTSHTQPGQFQNRQRRHSTGVLTGISGKNTTYFQGPSFSQKLSQMMKQQQNAEKAFKKQQISRSNSSISVISSSSRSVANSVI